MRHHAAFALQNLAVLLIVGLAAFYVIRRLARNAKGHADCGCGNCAEGGASKAPPAGPPSPPPASAA